MVATERRDASQVAQAITMATAVPSSVSTPRSVMSSVGSPGCTPRDEFDVLSAVRRAAEPPTPSQLAKSIAASNASITKRVVGLEAAGLVLRERSTSDRRVVNMVATPEGRASIDGALPDQLSLERELVGVLGAPERQELEGALRRVLLECDRRAGPAQPQPQPLPEPEPEPEPL
ncbi:MarR family winged helix-turn-helix transcriptional regulator [Subtercola boreus]|uniref:MarR family winged helix-turn-helix transcriptional regulator n=1 Tax=Subtercola boreus TaxID=120213 RepID=UPI001558DCAF|nr:MarR family transcriptional regulator [Subtercola boreus]